MKYVIIVSIKNHVLHKTLWAQSFTCITITRASKAKIKDYDPLTCRSCLDKHDACAMSIEDFEVKNR